MKVLGIAGSPRRGGNSETLLDRALDGIRSSEPTATVEKLVPSELKIAPCKACGFCAREGVCRFADTDDMKRVYELLDECDHLVVAAPVFFGNLPAQLKAMIDRCQPYWVRRFVRNERHPNRSRKGLFLCVGGFDHDRFYQCCRTVIKTWYICLDVELSADLFYPGIDKRGDIVKHAVATTEAFAAGQKLMKK